MFLFLTVPDSPLSFSIPSINFSRRIKIWEQCDEHPTVQLLSPPLLAAQLYGRLHMVFAFCRRERWVRYLMGIPGWIDKNKLFVLPMTGDPDSLFSMKSLKMSFIYHFIDNAFQGFFSLIHKTFILGMYTSKHNPVWNKPLSSVSGVIVASFSPQWRRCWWMYWTFALMMSSCQRETTNMKVRMRKHKCCHGNHDATTHSIHCVWLATFLNLNSQIVMRCFILFYRISLRITILVSCFSHDDVSNNICKTLTAWHEKQIWGEIFTLICVIILKYQISNNFEMFRQKRIWFSGYCGHEMQWSVLISLSCNSICYIYLIYHCLCNLSLHF